MTSNPDESAVHLKELVHDHWNAQACGAQVSGSPKFSKAYFEEIDALRYRIEPEIFSFAQFTRHHGERVLEAGVGAGSDFMQWVRAGALAYGVDLTPEAIEHVRNRLAVYGLEAQELRVADCEALPFADDSFDLVYSWGVIHHTPNTAQALSEMVRVLRPGGLCKLMVYNRRSLTAFYVWIKWALLRGRPWKSIRWCFYHCVESPGTKAFSRREIEQMLSRLPIEGVQIQPILTHQDRLREHNAWLQRAARLLAALRGDRAGFYMTIVFKKSARVSKEAEGLYVG